MDQIKELKEILKTVGAPNIWQPVVVNGDKLLADGIGDACDGHRDRDGVLDFECNLFISVSIKIRWKRQISWRKNSI